MEDEKLAALQKFFASEKEGDQESYLKHMQKHILGDITFHELI